MKRNAFKCDANTCRSSKPRGRAPRASAAYCKSYAHDGRALAPSRLQLSQLT